MRILGIGCGRASGGRKGVRERRGGAWGKPLVERGIGGEVGVFIVVVVVVIGEVGDKGPIGVGVGVEGFSTGQAGAVDEHIAKVVEGRRLSWREEALGESERDFGEDATDFLGRDDGAGRRGEFTVQIGGAEAAERGVRVGEAEPVGSGTGRLGAAASVGKEEAAEGERERVLALARHRESITNVISIYK